MSKILYLSCHAILEQEEVSLLHELGHEVFSPGAYISPDSPSEMRPGIDGLVYDPDVLKQFHAIHDKFPGEDNKDHLTKEFVDNFDCVFVMHLPRWVELNWQVMKHKRVIWRTIGQSVSNVENQLKRYRKEGLEIVRYSPMERNIPGFIGEDALIRFYKDPEEYKGWTGEQERVITFAQHMKQRDKACNYSLFEAVTRPFSRHLFGPGNEGQDWTSGKVSFEQLKMEMRTNRAYFYSGTHPASYTLNFMESLMTGIPVVAIGPEHGNAKYFQGHNLYEIPNLIKNGINGFVSDDPFELRDNIKTLFKDKDYAESIGMRGRKTAIELFGKDKIKEQWRNFLNG